jgi:hypothetical protein
LVYQAISVQGARQHFVDVKNIPLEWFKRLTNNGSFAIIVV